MEALEVVQDPAKVNSNKIIEKSMLIKDNGEVDLEQFQMGSELAGIFEAAGPFQQMVPQFPTGYGFTAIIVAFLGRLHPIGIILAGIILAVSYVGGEIAQTSLGLPNAAAGIFQAMMLFFLLATDILVKYRLRFGGSVNSGEAA